MQNLPKITTEQDIIDIVNELGILQFWDENRLSATTLSAVNFNKLWSLREKAVNSQQVVYGKFALKKTTFISKTAFPYFASLRRDGYDFDSLCDEGRVPAKEQTIMEAVGTNATPSYDLKTKLDIKGFDTAVTSLQNKTYLCLQFKKSYMGTAMLCRPEDIFGYDYVRSQYSLSPAECAEKLLKLCSGLSAFNDKELAKLLSPSI